MSDLPAMEPCPFHKAGRHDLAAVLPEDSDHDMTLWCTACGALRRVPVSGSLSSSLDHLDADAIAAAVSRIP